MADESTSPPKAGRPAPAKPPRKKATGADAASAKAEAPPPKAKAKAPEVRAPRRATLPPATRALLTLRKAIDGGRPIFGRQAANRYYRIGRDGSWRRPRGLQSKQRRHYGYRAQLVSIGYGSPAKVRGLVPSGFRPVPVHRVEELEGIDAKTQAAVIARTVGTRRRLGIEEAARKLGVRVLNPIATPEEE